MTRRPRGAKPQAKGAQWPAGRPYFELVQAGTWRLHSPIVSQEYPIPESQWKPGGVTGRPRGWPPGHPSPPN
jgi:hypothetical protein